MHQFHSVGSAHQGKIPQTTRSAHSLALNNFRKQLTLDLNLTGSIQLEESRQSNHCSA